MNLRLWQRRYLGGCFESLNHPPRTVFMKMSLQKKKKNVRFNLNIRRTTAITIQSLHLLEGIVLITIKKIPQEHAVHGFHSIEHRTEALVGFFDDSILNINQQLFEILLTFQKKNCTPGCRTLDKITGQQQTTTEKFVSGTV